MGQVGHSRWPIASLRRGGGRSAGPGSVQRNGCGRGVGGRSATAILLIHSTQFRTVRARRSYRRQRTEVRAASARLEWPKFGIALRHCERRESSRARRSARSGSSKMGPTVLSLFSLAPLALTGRARGLYRRQLRSVSGCSTVGRAGGAEIACERTRTRIRMRPRAVISVAHVTLRRRYRSIGCVGGGVAGGGLAPAVPPARV